MSGPDDRSLMVPQGVSAEMNDVGSVAVARERSASGIQSVEVVAVSTDDYRPAYADLLNSAERARLERFTRPADAVRCALGMVLLRIVASGRTGVDTRRIDVDRTCPRCGAAHGKPRIADGSHYSVTHAADLVVVAATSVGEIGIDIEPADRRPIGVSSSVSWPTEVRSWVRREAVVKAIGDGRAVEVGDPIVEETAGLLTVVHASGTDRTTLTVVDLDLELGCGYVGALATRSAADVEVVHRRPNTLLAHRAM